MDRFEFDQHQLHPQEDKISKHRSVKIYDGDQKNATFENGELMVTSHRLLYSQNLDQSRSSTGVCLKLHYVVYIEEEKSSGFGFSRSRKISLHLTEPQAGKQPGPVERSFHNFIRLSFKEGYDGNFITALNTVIQRKKWEIAPALSLPSSSAQPSGRIIRAGIVGIERQIHMKQKATDQSISLAFEDLSKLMVMAKDMVHLSKSISDKIKEHQGDITEDETVKFKSYLLSLGIEDPVTRDAFRSESQYHKNLAQQIATMLEKPITEIGGMMTMAEAYCRVNRARGLELLSPDDMLRACDLMAALGLPVALRTFDSGVKVLQLPSHNDEAIAKATADALKETGSFTAEELAQSLGISILLAKERLNTTEKVGKACRDDSIEGLRFYPNLFLQK